ncbi:ATP-dependent helicase [Variovorax sp. J22R133]|uniref:UvrD-helicase domain-containing protein n=1 Tax=Variovorax brevis TaxID=3053503 RepID=UPI002576A536|nr:ATP-dependent helicase [Variovorax sp. J22R133]MDM0115657.1 ATP-dependent helicase [Variovorax sp. J22R133]
MSAQGSTPDVLPWSGIGVTSEQHAILDHLTHEPVTVVSAGAGAGKTYTTVAAVTELVASGKANADEFVLITFTNQAASEMRERLQKEWLRQRARSGDLATREKWIEQRERLSASFAGTIHGFCKQLLDLYGYEGGIAREATVSVSSRRLADAVRDVALQYIESGDQDPVGALVKQRVLAEYELRNRLTTMVQEARNLGIRTGDLLVATRRQADDDGKALRVRFAQCMNDIESRYEHACEVDQKLDPAALLLKTSALLHSEDGPAVLERIGRRFRYLFIDEFQDTSATQVEIASALARVLKVVVVGDRKQAIYAFTGANQTLLMKFAKQHATHPLPLRLSGRPSKPLLDVQNALFRSMKSRFPDLDDPLQASDRNVVPGDKLPPCVVLYADQGDDHEKLNAAARIRGLFNVPVDRSDGGRSPVEPGDIAVLVRSNYEVGEWVDALQAQGVLARADSGTPILRRPEVVATYRLLQLLVRYPDDVALVEALNTPYLREVDLSPEIASLMSYGRQRGRPLTDAFERRFGAIATKLIDIRNASLTATVPQLLGHIDETFGLKRWYREAGVEDAALALDRLRDYARNQFANDQALTLRTFVEILGRDISAGKELREAAEHEVRRPPYVRVMTIHRAKGLEFPIVVIPNLQATRSKTRPPKFMLDAEHGLEINLWPDVNSASRRFFDLTADAKRASLSEEMRLFYVAVTRAQRMVLLLGQDAPSNEAGNEGNSKNHSWQDEVSDAEAAMKRNGARFGRLLP